MAQEVVHRGVEMRVRAHSKENEEVATHSDAVDEEKEEEEEGGRVREYLEKGGEKAGPRGFTEGVLSQAVEKSRP